MPVSPTFTLPVLIALAAALAGAAEPSIPVKIEFNRDVLPVLSDNCFACHGPDAKQRKAKLRLDVREEALRPAESGDTPGAIAAWRTLLQLDAPDPAGAHFQLAQLLRKNGETAEARSQTLLALEEAPRFREALTMLLQLSREEKK